MRSSTEHFVLFGLVLPELERPKLGITVSRRVGKAVVRNRLKRRVRECFRLKLRPMIEPDTVLVVIARPGAGEIGTPTINGELLAGTLSLSKRLKAQSS